MQMHGLKRRIKNTKSSQVGRGGKRGKTAGKGTKGQNARAGRKKRPEIRDAIKRLPKLRGRGANFLKSIKTKPVVINISDLNNFKDGEKVDIKLLIEKGMVKKISGKMPAVKILGDGEITKRLSLIDLETSDSAKKKIISAGGVVE